MPLLPYQKFSPTVDDSSWVAPTAWVTGQTTLEKNVSVLFGASLRGDINPIIVQEGANIQDNAVLHTSKGLGPCVVGPGTTVGHSAILHGCTVEGWSIIGMGATVLDNVVIEPWCIIGAQALIPMGMRIPSGSLVVGVPGKIIRSITEDEREQIQDTARRYIEVGRIYKTAIAAESV